jgi:hypothetical protein
LTVSPVLMVVGLKLSSVGSCFGPVYCGVSIFCSGVKIVNSLFSSADCVVLVSVAAPVGCGDCRMLSMSFRAAVSLWLSLGKGKGTLDGNHVRVSAVLVPLVSEL